MWNILESQKRCVVSLLCNDKRLNKRCEHNAPLVSVTILLKTGEIKQLKQITFLLKFYKRLLKMFVYINLF